jgi:hypothetical protein
MKKLLLASALLLTTIAIYSFTSGKGDTCPAEGKQKKGKAELKPREQNLNKHINRNSVPAEGDFDYKATTDKMYNSKDDSIWSEEKAGKITGYYFKAVDDGAASCNCYTDDNTKYSTKIYISVTPVDKNTRMADCIVAVITPYSRSLHPEWTADNLNSKMGGNKVTISGWLIYDYLHSAVSIETNSNSSKPERRTIWGICPVTSVVSED